LHKPQYFYICRGIGALAAFFSLLFLAGWIADIKLLLQLNENVVPIQFNTALLGLLCGLALFIQHRSRGGDYSAAFSLIAALFSLLVLAQYVFDVNLHIDTLFIEPHIVINTSHPGRMAPNTAVAFFLLSAGLFHIQRRPNSIFIATAAMVAFIIAYVSLVGYVSGWQAAYAWSGLTHMAPQSAFLILLISLALMVQAYHLDAHKHFFEKRWIVVPLMLSMVAGSFLLWYALERYQSRQINDLLRFEMNDVHHALGKYIRSDFQALERMLKRAESGVYDTEQHWYRDAQFFIDDINGLAGMAWRSSADTIRSGNITGDWSVLPVFHSWENSQSIAFNDRDLYMLVTGESHQIMARFDKQLFFGPITNSVREDNLNLAIHAYGMLVYGSRMQGAPQKSFELRTHIHQPGNWTITLWPDESLLSSVHSNIPLVLLLSALAISLLVPGLVAMSQRMVGQQKTVAEINKSLQAEIEQRKNVQADMQEAHDLLAKNARHLKDFNDARQKLIRIDNISEMLSFIVEFTRTIAPAQSVIISYAHRNTGELKCAGEQYEQVLEAYTCEDLQPVVLPGDGNIPPSASFRSLLAVPLSGSRERYLGVIQLVNAEAGHFDERAQRMVLQWASICATKLELLQIRLDLEDEVARRTHDLQKSNKKLQQEIKERHKAELELRRSEESFRLAFENAAIGRAIADPSGRFIRVNRAFMRIVDYSEQALLAKKWPEITHPDDVEACAQNMENLVSGKQSSFTQNLRVFNSRGEDVWIRLNVVLVRESSGHPAFFVGDIQDITEKLKIDKERVKALENEQAARRELELTNTRQKALIKTMGSVLASQHDMNKALQALADGCVPGIADWTAVDLYDAEKHVLNRIAVSHPDPQKVRLARELYELYPPDLSQEPGLGQLVRTGKSQLWSEIKPELLEMAAQDEKHLDILKALGLASAMAVPLKAGDKIIGALTFVSSESGRHYDEEDLMIAEDVARRTAIIIENARLYKQMENVNNLLERRVHERTRQLEAVNKELESFSYSVSHDLRAPLRHISAFVRNLSERYKDKLDERGQRFVEVISSSAERMGVLIDDLLEFSRMGRAELRMAKVNLNEIVKKVLDENSEEIEQCGALVSADTLPEVNADGALIRQVLNNLLENALKYSGTVQKPKVKIGYHCDEENAEHVISVSDNGVGFDMSYAHKLFNVFQRLHARDEFEGTGIGLANVKRIVTRHGGRVWAEGRVNEGATFYFTLPLEEKKVLEKI